MRQKIKEILVVEGKHDTSTLQAYFDCDTIETGGDQVSADTIERVRQAQKTRGVIVFTDPDTPGEHIRRILQEQVPECKHAFIAKDKARTSKKVGVEHARKEDLWDALCHVVSFENTTETLSWEDFVEMGLTGQSDSTVRRNRICEKFHIGPCNAKTCFKRLNQMHVTKEQIKEG